MKFLSVCSGIEAASVAWNPLGWESVGFSEIEPFPCQVLKHHYPHVPNLGDMTKFKEWNLGPIDLFCGGTPCQSFSVAGLRKGLDDPRGNLMLTYLAIADKFRPRWLVWENVPGVLSSNGGRDFGSFLGGLGQLGYGFAYRVLDAQYFGVAQRRKRVFVVGYLGDWRPAAAVLFERDSLCGNPAPSREKRQETSRVAGTLTANCGGLNRPAGNANELDFCIPTTTGTLCAQTGKSNSVQDAEQGHLMAIPIDSMNHLGRNSDNHSMGDFVPGAPCYTLTKQHSHAVAQPISFDLAQITSKTNRSNVGPDLPVSTISKGSDMHIAQPIGIDEECNATIDGFGPLLRGGQGGTRQAVAYSIMPMNSGKDYKARQTEISQPLMAGGPVGGNQGGDYLVQKMAVRRLTPVECERLQGFPDHYTDIKPKGKPTPDGPRYKALGNSWAVPVARWIGERIMMVEAMK